MRLCCPGEWLRDSVASDYLQIVEGRRASPMYKGLAWTSIAWSCRSGTVPYQVRPPRQSGAPGLKLN